MAIPCHPHGISKFVYNESVIGGSGGVSETGGPFAGYACVGSLGAPKFTLKCQGLLTMSVVRGWPLQQTARLASSANGKVGLFSKQQGWPLQQAARLASSANSRVGLFSSSKVGLFSKRLGWPPQQTVTLATSATIGLATSANSNVDHFSKQ
ncbi:hypothetical protein Btru_038018 [Bulinus truncatus]|nr:hypothetical protein Btru_038018 [Bulinus truncatus]